MSEKWKLLLVEDDPEDQWLIKRSFERPPEVTLEIVSNGKEALDYLRDTAAELPDLILLDMNMPIMNGPAFMKELANSKLLPHGIPIIILTTSDEEEYVLEAYELGASAYMVKPPTLEEFKELAEKLERFWCDCVKLPQNKRLRMD